MNPTVYIDGNYVRELMLPYDRVTEKLGFENINVLMLVSEVANYCIEQRNMTDDFIHDRCDVVVMESLYDVVAEALDTSEECDISYSDLEMCLGEIQHAMFDISKYVVPLFNNFDLDKLPGDWYVNVEEEYNDFKIQVTESFVSDMIANNYAGINDDETFSLSSGNQRNHRSIL